MSQSSPPTAASASDGSANLNPAPAEITGKHVLPEWIDYNGHMNVGYYVVAFDQALDKLCDQIDLGLDYVKRTNNSIFVLEMHITYQREVVVNDPLRFTWHLLDWDEKRFHYFMEMHHATEGWLAATSEQIAIHVDLGTRKTCPLPAAQQDTFRRLAPLHAKVPRATQVGQLIGIKRKS